MEQEAEYIEALMEAASFRLVEDRLEILNDDEETILLYQAK